MQMGASERISKLGILATNSTTDHFFSFSFLMSFPDGNTRIFRLDFANNLDFVLQGFGWRVTRPAACPSDFGFLLVVTSSVGLSMFSRILSVLRQKKVSFWVAIFDFHRFRC